MEIHPFRLKPGQVRPPLRARFSLSFHHSLSNDRSYTSVPIRSGLSSNWKKKFDRFSFSFPRAIVLYMNHPVRCYKRDRRRRRRVFTTDASSLSLSLFLRTNITLARRKNRTCEKSSNTTANSKTSKPGA